MLQGVHYHSNTKSLPVNNCKITDIETINTKQYENVSDRSHAQLKVCHIQLANTKSNTLHLLTIVKSAKRRTKKQTFSIA